MTRDDHENPTSQGVAPSGLLDPALALQMMAGTDEAVRRSLTVNTAGIYLAFGLSWVIGYACYTVSIGRDGVPEAWAGIVLAATLVAAGIVTAVLITRASRGVRGASSRIGTMIGVSWALAFMATFTLIGSFVGQADLAGPLAAKLFGITPILLVGLIYLVQGSVLGDMSLFLTGSWIVIVAAIAMLVSPLAASFLVVAIAGGGGLLVAAWNSWRRQKRVNARAY